jgi:hypothetical protein
MICKTRYKNSFGDFAEFHRLESDKVRVNFFVDGKIASGWTFGTIKGAAAWAFVRLHGVPVEQARRLKRLNPDGFMSNKVTLEHLYFFNLLDKVATDLHFKPAV